jgi:hypothetical protein
MSARSSIPGSRTGLQGSWRREGWRVLMGLAWLLSCAVLRAEEAAGQPAADGNAKSGPVSATVAYVAEIPYQWQSETGNPLELWARRLSSKWSGGHGSGSERLRNIRAELSWDRLARIARTGKAHAFVVHGYEFIERGEEAHLEALLVPSRDGRAAMTEFIILRQRAGGGRQFDMHDLKDREILLDRGGCGDLVYRWLDHEIRPGTGDPGRNDLAQFRTASNAAEAILAVYFGDVYACVVSRSAYSEAIKYNPRGLTTKLEEVRSSPPLLQYVIACPKNMPAPRRKELVKGATGIELLNPDGVWTLAPPQADDLKSLTKMIREWQVFFGPPGVDQADVPAPPAPPVVAPVSATRRGSDLTDRKTG